MHKYFKNITYIETFSATQGGLDLSAVWRGFKESVGGRVAHCGAVQTLGT